MLVLIDGDVLCYQACENRWSFKYPEYPPGYVHLNSDGSKAILEFSKDDDRKYLEKCWENLNKNLQEVIDSVYGTDYLMAVKSDYNFRDVIYSDYKANRKNRPPTGQTEVVPILRKLVVAEGMAIEAYGREADDLLRMWSYQAEEAGDPFVISSHDKDLKCIPGLYYNMKSKELFKISKEEAMRHYYEQLLKGDPTDHIPGLPNVGEKKAAKILSSCNTEAEFQEAVVGSYIAHYQDDWYGQLLSNGKMIHLQLNENDYFNFSSWPIVKELT